MANLFTHHDPYRFHAICGLMVLIHFFYRLRLLFRDVPDSGFGTNLAADTGCMVIMILPNVTSFVFNIVPARRAKSDGFTIWKEYRWHAFIFASKIWFLMGIFIFQRHYLPNGLPYERYIRVGVEFTTMFAAKIVTDMYPSQESTIRGMYKGSPFAIFFASMCQFLGRAANIYGLPKDDINLQFFGIFVLQANAFNMTLRKKRIIGPTAAQAFYISILLTAVFLLVVRRLTEDPPTGFFDPRFKAYYLGCVAYALRRNGFGRFMTWLVAMTIMDVVSNQFDLFQPALTYE